MKNNILTILFVSAFSLLLTSCEKSILERPEADKKAVFEAFWNGIDQKYSYFDLKNIDWQGVHDHYSPLISNSMSDDAFFDTLSVLVDILQDGHSGLYSPFNDHKNPGFFLRGPENFDERLLVDSYAHGWGNVTGTINHSPLREGQVAYVYYSTFTGDISEADLDYIIDKYKDTKGMIIDIRNNTGGSASNIFMLVRRFIQTETDLFNSRMKSGSGHDEFTGLTKTTIKPAEKTYKGKVCVLTNRKVYSAASIFTLSMREVPGVTIVGDTTGGGLGLPIGFELPNEWQVHCAGSQTLSLAGENFELGVPCDVDVDMSEEDRKKGIDSILEKAIEIILGDK